MVYHKNFFIYDEKNYTKLDIYGEKMKALNLKQNTTYSKNNNLSNYIFVIESLNEKEQTLEDVADNLSEKIKLELDYYNKHNYILAVFAIKNRKVQFYAGTTSIQKITKSEHDKILSNIKNYMTSGEYYKAWTKVIDDYDYYYNNTESIDLSQLSKFLVFLPFAAIIIIICICANKKGCCLYSSSGNNNYRRYTRNNDSRASINIDTNVSYGSFGGDRGGSIGSIGSGGGGGSW